ncbi:MAG TPA: SDR family oxidoreductase, partial [Gaiellaceae bacterium]|nr:SDR family oxidoreductase [Gaiellaceae bacterium]
MSSGSPLQGKAAVVTGASRGIGEAVARKLEALGAQVATLQRSEGPGAWIRCDLESAEDAERGLEEAAEQLGRVDICVCNAGTMFRAPALDLPVEELRRVIEVNVVGAFVVSRAAARRMVAQGDGGRIVHIASMMSFHAGINTLAYAASKGALAQMMKAQANEWAPLGIRVNAVAPGWVATELTTALREDEKRFAEISARIPVGRWANGDDIAGAVAFLCLPESAYVNGTVLPVDGGWLA